MNCTDTREKLNALIDRELGIRDWVRTRVHLARCPECRQRLREYSRITQVSSRVRNISGKGSNRLLPGLAMACTIAVVGLMVVLWPKPNPPRALVYDHAFLEGKAAPVSEIFSEGDHLVVRDPRSGSTLASAPGHTRKDAFYAISAANRIPTDAPKEFVVDRPEIDLRIGEKGNGDAEIFLVVGDPGDPKMGEQSIVFFTGDVPNFKELKLPAGRPAYFVKIIDPGFLSDLDSDRRSYKFVPAPNKKPQPINR